ncbi:hypothetical protein, partial [Caballeronia mineralivorans]|uniref:hypothetical protein n=1 Tax=Caballeronia mineralivorans TaxID=2010198 RepID=UPI002AFE881A
KREGTCGDLFLGYFHVVFLFQVETAGILEPGHSTRQSLFSMNAIATGFSGIKKHYRSKRKWD